MLIHSGTLVWLLIVLMGAVAIIGQAAKPLKTKWRPVHRMLGLFMLLLLIAHLVPPYWLMM